MLRERIAAGDFPSAVYLVAERGRTRFADARGDAVREPDRHAATLETIYDLASLTKPLVTGLLTVMHVERGGVSLDAPDPTHQSPPLGWTAFGSVHRRAPDGDYPAVAARLVAAGADITARGNRENRTMVEMAKGNPAMQEALRRLGAR